MGRLEVCIASKNTHKVDEYRTLLAPLDWELVPLPEGLPDCPEDGHSFEANAMEKAVFYSQLCHKWVLADDSGLVVPVLGGEPGVQSARYAGRHGDDAANNQKLLRRLSEHPGEREALFVCSLALWNEDSEQGIVVRGTVKGHIVQQERGTSGFGYDPLFEYSPFEKTFGEMDPADKNAVSHRSQAVQALIRVWQGGMGSALVRSE